MILIGGRHDHIRPEDAGAATDQLEGDDEIHVEIIAHASVRAAVAA
jgi:hypothetical protein